MIKSFKVCGNLDHCLSQLNENSKLAVAVSVAHAHNSPSISPSQIYCYDGLEIIHDYNLKFLIRNDFPYLMELNAFIQKISEGGVIKKWCSNNSIRTSYEHAKPNKQIVLKHLHGVLIVLVALETWAFSIFVFEKYVAGKMQASNPNRFWIIMDMIIDGDRHFLLESKMIY